MKDTLVVGVIAGIVGTVVMHIFSMIFMALGWVTVTTLEYSAAIFLDPNEANTLAGTIVAYTSHFMIGGAGGVLLAFLIKITGKDYYWLKGLAIAGAMLLVGMAFVLDLMNLMPEMRKNSVTVLLHFVTYFAYGLTVSYIIAKLGQFEDKRIEGDKERVFKVAPGPAKKPEKQVVHPVKPKKIK